MLNLAFDKATIDTDAKKYVYITEGLVTEQRDKANRCKSMCLYFLLQIKHANENTENDIKNEANVSVRACKDMQTGEMIIALIRANMMDTYLNLINLTEK